MSNELIFYIMGGAGGAFVLILIAYFVISKKMQKSEYKKIQRLQQGTREKAFGNISIGCF